MLSQMVNIGDMISLISVLFDNNGITNISNCTEQAVPKPIHIIQFGHILSQLGNCQSYGNIIFLIRIGIIWFVHIIWFWDRLKEHFLVRRTITLPLVFIVNLSIQL